MGRMPTTAQMWRIRLFSEAAKAWAAGVPTAQSGASVPKTAPAATHKTWYGNKRNKR